LALKKVVRSTSVYVGTVFEKPSSSETLRSERHSLNLLRASVCSLKDLYDYTAALALSTSNPQFITSATQTLHIHFMAREAREVTDRRFAHHLDDMQEKNHFLAGKSAMSTYRLASLAAFFLPMSLASSILSIETRFKDLHLMLFDFAGVSIILITISMLCYGLVIWVQRKKWDWLNPRWRFSERRGFGTVVMFWLSVAMIPSMLEYHAARYFWAFCPAGVIVFWTLCVVWIWISKRNDRGTIAFQSAVFDRFD
jgi:hypothetical protein